jgi:hypothetical protein
MDEVAIKDLHGVVVTTSERRSRYGFSGNRYAIQWPKIDEDPSVPGLLGLPD